MGIYDRDYARASYTRRQLWGGDLPVIKSLIAVNIAVYVLQVLTINSQPGITQFLALKTDLFVGSFQIWRLLTYAFCHDPLGPSHILFNMLALWWFGGELERMYGSREFVSFYLVSAVVSGICFLLIQVITAVPSTAIGASGAVMAVMMVYAVNFPRQIIRILGIFPVEAWMIVAFYVAYDAYPVLLALGGTQAADGVAHAAHLGGLAFGYFYTNRNLRLSGLSTGWSLKRFRKSTGPKLFREKPDLRVYREEPEPPASKEIDARVDELLAKISRQGEASLTEEERKTLFEASRRYRQRRS